MKYYYFFVCLVTHNKLYYYVKSFGDNRIVDQLKHSYFDGKKALT